jgi:hypothetical protein
MLWCGKEMSQRWEMLEKRFLKLSKQKAANAAFFFTRRFNPSIYVGSFFNKKIIFGKIA